MVVTTTEYDNTERGNLLHLSVTRKSTLIVTMRENIRFIVTEVNKLLGRNYNIIVFNALSPEELLQVLKEVLIKIQQNDANVDTGNDTPEEISIYILSILRIFNYQPQTDPASFRQGLIRGDPDTIHPILTWLLSHVDVVQKRAYLSRFLVKVEIPVEYLGDSEVASLYEQYGTLIERFKAAHKEREIGKKNVESASELTTDLQTMEKEKEAVTIRIEKMKAKAEPGSHLLDAARALRVERDKERDLAMQKEQEREFLSRLQISLQRLERDIQVLKKGESDSTVQALLQHLSEVITVQTIVLKEKLPFELKAKRNRLKALTAVKKSSYLGPDQITALRNKLDGTAKEIQDLVELKISKTNIDKMEPFRQQAAAVANIKRNVLERLEKTESSLHELQMKLGEKRELSKFVLEEAAPKGDEMKKYVARLKTRSTLYKHSKTELAGLTAENSVLYRTAVILENQLGQCNQTKRILETVKNTTPDNFTVENASSLNLQLSGEIAALRAKLVPLVNEVQTLRKKSREFEERHEKAEKSHNAVESSISGSISALISETEAIKAKLAKDTEEKERLVKLIKKMKATEERIQRDSQEHGISDPGKKIKEELNNAILSEEGKIKSLMLEKEMVKESAVKNEKQTRMWNSIISVFECKIQCVEESKQANGIVLRRGGAETLVLQ